MARTKKQQPKTPRPIGPDTDLGFAMLIAEDEEGHYEPVGVASTINEAREIAVSNMRARVRRVERGLDPGLCPYEYKVWGESWGDGVGCRYRIVATFPSTSL